MKSDEKCNSKPLPSPLLHHATLAAMDAAVMWEEELSSVDATPLSFFSSSSSSHCTPLSSVWRQGELLSGGERGGGGDGRSSSSSAASFTFTTASRRRSMACGSAGRMNWKHSWKHVRLCVSDLESMPSGVTFRDPISIARDIPGASRSITSRVAWREEEERGGGGGSVTSCGQIVNDILKKNKPRLKVKPLHRHPLWGYDIHGSSSNCRPEVVSLE
ncbi:hypothetical protein EYF80_013625 [Liparis tanakae]|uniref:Uncharacterized protein n=1 Tax=Liparis tanakae TaxID=230148 RepID=A0A4Z2IF61_9TELE|nr:hypothetical protein EYF80_013625 [Liparis tanakae]